jgi:NAD dependent epimerase/dehydratase
VKVELGDIRDYDSVHSAVKGHDVVIHLAALIGIPYSYRSPLGYIRTNVEGTYNILEAAKQLNAEQVIILSTSETYGSGRYMPMDEEHPLIGQSPYAASKIGADQLAISYYRSFGLPVKIARPFNTYGPRQSARAIIPTIITQALSGQRLVKLGNLSSTRDFTFVKDTCKGLFEIYRSELFAGEVVNIGTNTEISIGDLVKKIANTLETEIEIDYDHARERPENSEVSHLRCNNKKLLSKTKWKPDYNLERGLEETVDWIKQSYKQYKPQVYNI